MAVLNSLMLVLFTVAVMGCGEDIPLPNAKPLNVSEQWQQNIYGIALGSHSVDFVETQLTDRDDYELPLRIAYPAEEGQYPLLVFSHGNWSDNTKYDKLIKHWVSHGYVVIMPYHLDGGGMARGIYHSLRLGNLALIERRSDDIKLILDSLESIEHALPQLVSKIDAEQLAVTGHSFGGFTAQQMIGAGAFDPDNNTWSYKRDDRVKAVVALSPPGEMFDEITKDSWLKMDKPMLLTTGTWDVASFWPTWDMHRISFDTAVAGKNYALVIDGADHYLGNLICRPEREQAPQQDALNMVNATSIAFLDWHLKGRVEAQMALEFQAINTLTNNFASLSSR